MAWEIFSLCPASAVADAAATSTKNALSFIHFIIALQSCFKVQVTQGKVPFITGPVIPRPIIEGPDSGNSPQSGS